MQAGSGLAARGSAAAVEALDAVTARDRPRDAGVRGMAVRAHVDRERVGGRAERERRATGCAERVDEVQLRMLGQMEAPFDVPARPWGFAKVLDLSNVYA